MGKAIVYKWWEIGGTIMFLDIDGMEMERGDT